MVSIHTATNTRQKKKLRYTVTFRTERERTRTFKGLLVQIYTPNLFNRFHNSCTYPLVYDVTLSWSHLTIGKMRHIFYS
jgi:hypothetical protein